MAPRTDDDAAHHVVDVQGRRRVVVDAHRPAGREAVVQDDEPAAVERCAHRDLGVGLVDHGGGPAHASQRRRPRLVAFHDGRAARVDAFADQHRPGRVLVGRDRDVPGDERARRGTGGGEQRAVRSRVDASERARRGIRARRRLGSRPDQHVAHAEHAGEAQRRRAQVGDRERPPRELFRIGGEPQPLVTARRLRRVVAADVVEAVEQRPVVREHAPQTDEAALARVALQVDDCGRARRGQLRRRPHRLVAVREVQHVERGERHDRRGDA
jgi:hypothetical protein